MIKIHGCMDLYNYPSYRKLGRLRPTLLKPLSMRLLLSVVLCTTAPAIITLRTINCRLGSHKKRKLLLNAKHGNWRLLCANMWVSRFFIVANRSETKRHCLLFQLLRYASFSSCAYVLRLRRTCFDHCCKIANGLWQTI